MDPRWHFHRYQLNDTYRALHRDYINRSVLGYVSIFNLLPDVVFVYEDEQIPISVQSFQKNRTRFLRFVSCLDGCWLELFYPRAPLANHLLRNFRNLDVIPDV